MWRILKLFIPMGFLLATTPAVFGGDPTAIINNNLWFFSNVTNIQQVGQPIGNLVEYKVTFSDLDWPAQYVYVDNNLGDPNYTPLYSITNGIYNGQSNVPGFTGSFITDPVQIQRILSQSRELNPFDGLPDIFHPGSSLLAYISPVYPGTVLVTDQKHDYLEIGGSVATALGFQVGKYASSYAIYNSYAQRLYTLANSGNFGVVVEGNANAKKTIIVLMEPNCPICNDFYTLSKPYVTSGQLQIHWIPTFFLDADSRGKALAILMGDVPQNSGYPHTPAGALAYDEDNFTVGNDDGGAIKPIQVNQASSTVINESNNNEFFLSYTSASDSVPTILYEDKYGNYQEIGDSVGWYAPSLGGPGGGGIVTTQEQQEAMQNLVNSLHVNP